MGFASATPVTRQSESLEAQPAQAVQRVCNAKIIPALIRRERHHLCQVIPLPEVTEGGRHAGIHTLGRPYGARHRRRRLLFSPRSSLVEYFGHARMLMTVAKV